MTLSPLLFLIVCPLTGLAGFVDAVAGGGGLISLPAYMIAGLPVHAAIGTNKLSSGMGTALATGRLAKGGNIPWRQAGLCILAALIGSWAGARLALLVDPEVFKRLMLVILPLTALYLLRSRPLGDGAGDLPRRAMTLRAALIALGVGVYDGFYGPGTGTFLLLLLTGFPLQAGGGQRGGEIRQPDHQPHRLSRVPGKREGPDPSGACRRGVQHRRQLHRHLLLPQEGQPGGKAHHAGGSCPVLREGPVGDHAGLISNLI